MCGATNPGTTPGAIKQDGGLSRNTAPGVSGLHSTADRIWASILKKPSRPQ